MCAERALFLFMMIASSVGLLGWSLPSVAYRPFDSTDADVAHEGEFELEFGPAGYLREGAEHFLVAPAVIGNLGFAAEREIVLEGKLKTPLNTAAGSQSILEDTALSLKQVHRVGSLQDGTGPSIGSECSVLLPTIHGESGAGVGCFGLVSQRWSAATVHFNAGLAFDRDHKWNKIVSGIVEGPHDWTVRPALEIFTEHDGGTTQTNSALIALIWRKQDNLSFDVGLRAARSAGEDVYEVRAGLTWSFAVDQLRAQR
jgi:hypothetical protein